MAGGALGSSGGSSKKDYRVSLGSSLEFQEGGRHWAAGAGARLVGVARYVGCLDMGTVDGRRSGEARRGWVRQDEAMRCTSWVKQTAQRPQPAEAQEAEVVRG